MKKIILFGDNISTKLISEWINDFNFYHKNKINILFTTDLNSLNKENKNKILKKMYKTLSNKVEYLVTYFDPLERYVVNKFLKKKKFKTFNFIHPSAIIRGIIIGKGNIFGPWSLLETNSTINENCLFLTNSVLKSGNNFTSKFGTTLGRYSKINKISENEIKIFENYFNNNVDLINRKKNANWPEKIQSFKNSIYW